jgi:hypothetical protein
MRNDGFSFQGCIADLQNLILRDATMPYEQVVKPKRELRWYQFSLRSLLIFVTLFACVCSFFAVIMQSANRQRDAVEALRKRGAYVLYDCQYYRDRNLDPPGPDGNDYFNCVASVQFWKNASDDDLRIVKILKHLRELRLSGTQITDAGLEHLQGMYIEELGLWDTHITDAGVDCLIRIHPRAIYIRDTSISDAGKEKLRNALPNSSIMW